jgi:hypothetical protein
VNKIILATIQNSTSGTSIDFTGIPSGVRRITVTFNGVSTSGVSDFVVQIGKSGGVETSGYLGSAAAHTGGGNALSNYTASFGVNPSTVAATVLHGQVILTLMDAATFLWAYSFTGGASNGAATYTAGGTKALAAELDRVRVTTAGGADTFDAGKINIAYER